MKHILKLALMMISLSVFAVSPPYSAFDPFSFIVDVANASIRINTNNFPVGGTYNVGLATNSIFSLWATNAPDGFQIASTNGVATYVNGATNGLASTVYVMNATNGFITGDEAVTNVAPNAQYGVFNNFSTNFFLPPTSQNWRVGRATPNNQPSLSVVHVTPSSWKVDTEGTTSFWEYPFPIPPGVTNVTGSVTMWVPTGTAGGLIALANWPGSIAYSQITPTLTTTPTTYSVTSGATNQAMFVMYSTGQPFMVSNLNLTYNGVVTDPVLSQPFKHYDILRQYWQQNTYRGYLPLQNSEASRCEFTTDAQSITFELFGNVNNLVLPFLVYVNSQLVLSINDFPTNNFYYTNYANLILGAGQKTIQVVNGAALQINGGTQQIDFYNGTTRYLHTMLRSLFVPSNSECYFTPATDNQRKVFVFGDSIMLNGGQLTNNADATLWDLVQRFTGIKASLYAAGSWTLNVNFNTTKTNFWKAVAVSDATEMYCNIGYNDYTASLGTNLYFTYLTNMFVGTHVLKPAWTIYAQEATAAAADIGPVLVGGFSLQQYRDAMSNAATMFPWCVLVQPPLVNTNDMYNGLHPTPTGNIKYAAKIYNALNFYPPNYP